MKYVVSLYSKYTGDSIYLGSSYKTREEAEAYDYCDRCNYLNVHSVPDDYVWFNKEHGFVGREYRKELSDKEKKLYENQ